MAASLENPETETYCRPWHWWQKHDNVKTQTYREITKCRRGYFQHTLWSVWPILCWAERFWPWTFQSLRSAPHLKVSRVQFNFEMASLAQFKRELLCEYDCAANGWNKLFRDIPGLQRKRVIKMCLILRSDQSGRGRGDWQTFKENGIVQVLYTQALPPSQLHFQTHTVHRSVNLQQHLTSAFISLFTHPI